eukprot:scaffold7389_cov48-Phaeocystis_antarctica.AAC.3
MTTSFAWAWFACRSSMTFCSESQRFDEPGDRGDASSSPEEALDSDGDCAAFADTRLRAVPLPRANMDGMSNC